jgi:hypothetical protein
MFRTFLELSFRKMSAVSAARSRHQGLPRWRHQLPALECLEGRALVANITASAVITSAPSAPDFNRPAT